MTADELKNLFEKEYDRKEWTEAMVEIFHIRSLYQIPQKIELGANDYGAEAFELGYFDTTEGLQVGIYEVCISAGKRLDRNKAGLRQLMRKVFKVDNDAALIVFTQGSTWRFTYASELTVINKETRLRERRQTDSKRYTYLLGRGQQCRTATERFSGLKSSIDLFSENTIPITEIEKAFSVETLTKQFYKELFDWYQWALSDNDDFAVTFPNNTNTTSDDRKIEEHLIRLITRLMFVWFIKQKKLVPDEIFNKDALKSLLKQFDPLSKTEGNYYNAILQNFFFATLNKAIDDRAFAKDGEYRDRKEHYGIKSLFRNPKGNTWFTVSNDEILKIFSKAPFLNGGLFECLDKEEDSNGRIVYHDGFSREAGRQRRAFIPNCLFFDPAKGIIPLLEKYNFTIEESTPIDVEVALDPELLGKVFENLLGAFNPETKETARKQSGSFYTPREIVSYMVDESLIAYLNTKCPGTGEEQIRSLFAPGDNKFTFGEKERFLLTESLKSAKILDPACGSGAFPMGVLNRMVDLLQKLGDEECSTPYEQKLHLIQNCIYGIDIQTIAVQISKLRFFISLVSEQTTNADPAQNYGIVPLPNLETKFVAANTLVGLQKEFTDRLDLGFTDIRLLKDELWDIRSKHFSARNSDEKLKLRKQDEKLRKQIQKLLVDLTSKPDEAKLAQLKADIEALEAEKLNYIGENLVELANPKIQQGVLFETPAGSSEQLTIKIDKNKEERNRISKLIKEKQKEIDKENSRATHAGFEKDALQLAKWDPYDQNTSSAFFDAEWMFDAKEGFDVVIGNPPYIQLQKITETATVLKSGNFKTFERTGDIYMLFIEQGRRLLRNQGNLIYITNSTWLRTAFGESLKKYFNTEVSLLKIIDLSDCDLFENAAVLTTIIHFKDGDKGLINASGVRIRKTNQHVVYDLNSFFKLNSVPISSYNPENAWTILDKGKYLIKAKVEKQGTPLINWGLSIFRGILTGLNEAFVIDRAKRDELIAADPKSNEILKPLIRGRDVQRYRLEYSDLWLVGTFPKLKIDIEEYSAIHKYFNEFGKEKLVQDGTGRKKTGNKWFETQDQIGYWNEFEKPKIIFPNMTKNMPFCYDDSGYYTNQKCYIITGDHLLYLTAIFNSKLFEYCFRSNFPELLGGVVELSKVFFEKIPIKKPSKSTELILGEKALKIGESKKINPDSSTTNLENEIDEIIYKLYNLTYEEVKMVDPDFWLSEE
ncbi:MAG TPA: TaqI-like C-terminal specificity domain-containing protein, partial [Bacteroidales bacterium]|nr:TaqI-like C-terminal specificity domain-containing protein [Bacteroidales bacterium]